ncbi:MAG: hypothetical protein HZC02_02525 [Candidatus Levybacteria bacterium]|nr:hypothetical protein [Candidatus Levybacteria bacterium]
MEKNTKKIFGKVPAKVFIFLSILIIVVLGAVGFKFFIIDSFVASYEAKVVKLLQKQALKLSAEEATLLSTTFFNFPTKTNPLFDNQTQLQSYVRSFGESFKRLVIVTDMNKRIVADSSGKQVGSIYKFDRKEEVEKTLKDGKPRGYLQKKNNDMPEMLVVVLAMRDRDSVIQGAIIFSVPHTK